MYVTDYTFNVPLEIIRFKNKSTSDPDIDGHNAGMLFVYNTPIKSQYYTQQYPAIADTSPHHQPVTYSVCKILYVQL
jgi:hypothetical protein